MSAAKKEVPLEEAFDKIEELLEALESDEITLEDSFRYYEQGMKLIKYCNATIDKVEKKVQKLSEKGELDEF